MNSDILLAKFEGRELKFTRQPDSSPLDAQYIGEYVHVGDDFIMSYALSRDGNVKFSFKVPGQPTFTSVSHSLHGPSHVYTVDFTGSFEGVRYWYKRIRGIHQEVHIKDNDLTALSFVNDDILFAKFEGRELKFTRRSDRVPFDAQYIGRFVYDGDDFTMAFELDDEGRAKFSYEVPGKPAFTSIAYPVTGGPNTYAIDFTGSFEGVRYWYKRIRGLHQGVDIKDGDLTSLILTDGGIVATFEGLEFRFTRRPYPRANLRNHIWTAGHPLV
ncbi:hypothetical protein FOZ60_012285 [Perkinsus olseni]|uniref:Uncharacterized protein n=1 Tax=Perkinsus olseni TaxID=32597 RepID=A0A7J6NBQ5_PEROL|nr:hypothetical protein FOZ60_012285 [Perkinsus olseni]